MSPVIVIGGGVVGASVAFRMAQQGAAVTLLEAARLAGGTSTRSFAWTNAHNKLPHAYFALNEAGMRAHAALRDELGERDGGWLHDGGCVEWAVDAAQRERLRTRIERLRGWTYAAEEISAGRLRELEPDLEPGPGATIGFFATEGWIDAAPLVATLLARVRALGGTVRVGARVADILVAGGAVTGVRLDGGEVLSAALVVNCAGPTVNAVTPETGLHVPMASTAGLLVITAPAPARLRRVVQAAGGLALRPDGAGRVLIHSQDEDDGLAPDTVASPALPAVGRILDAAAAVLPAIAGVPRRASGWRRDRFRRTDTRRWGRSRGSTGITSR